VAQLREYNMLRRQLKWPLRASIYLSNSGALIPGTMMLSGHWLSALVLSVCLANALPSPNNQQDFLSASALEDILARGRPLLGLLDFTRQFHFIVTDALL
jgi:hypothetical protein